jgi:16S rRNA (cytidine1402-2'-O)-methyltransferase
MGTERRASISRELTKLFEETNRGTLAELIAYYSAKEIKGEIVIVIEGSDSRKEASEE